ncbi:MAG: sulfite exporter TauE/SafE family protein, partial [Pseudonocardia sp.]|nr:sulfite exporter TauE/SafE family protein [Pseudonocardia sp.]
PVGAVHRHRSAAQPAHWRLDRARRPHDAARALVRAGQGRLPHRGLITGVTETSTGVGGPPLALVYQHRPAPVLRSTVAACFLVGEVISLAMLAVSDKVSADQVRSAVLLLPAVIVGALLSRLVHHRLGGRLMRYVVLGFALVAGVVITAQAV